MPFAVVHICKPAVVLTMVINLFVLFAGNKEATWEGEPTPPTNPAAGTPYEAAQKHRRFQVYVHSKMMIVDDEVQPSPLLQHYHLCARRQCHA